MAERIVSPGVFTRERDLSFLPAGIAAIGACIVGPTIKGPHSPDERVERSSVEKFWDLLLKILKELSKK